MSDSENRQSPEPASGFAQYPRASNYYPGSVEQLEALFQAYNGLSLVFGVNVLLSLGLNFVIREYSFVILIGMVLGFTVVIGALSLPQTRKLAFGKGWAPKMAILASGLLGLNSALCCGIIGYVVLQQIASSEIKRYGVRSGFLGVRKKDVQAKVAEMRSSIARPF